MTATRSDAALLLPDATARRLLPLARATSGETDATASPLDGSHLADVPQSTLDDVDAIEINEAFAAQTLGCAKELGLDMAKLNQRGGGIALGLILLAIWFILQFIPALGQVAVETGGGEGVAYFAHVGGFVFGLAVAGLILAVTGGRDREEPPRLPVY